MLRFGLLGNRTEYFETNDSFIFAAIIVVNEDNEPVANVQIKLKLEDRIIVTKQTDSNGSVKIKVPKNTYTLIISGDKIEDTVITNYNVTDIIISVTTKKYIELKPERIFLNPANMFKENVEVFSNTDWQLL